MARLDRWRREDRAVAPDALRTNVQRAAFLGFVVAAMNVLHLVWLLADRPTPDAPTAVLTWHKWLCVAHASMGASMLLGGMAAWWVRRRRDPGLLGVLVTWWLAIQGLSHAVAITVIDQWVTSNITPYTLGTLAIAVLVLLPPRPAAYLFLAHYALYAVAIALPQDDGVLLLSNRLQGLGNTVVAWALAAILWRNFATITLQRRELLQAHEALRARHREVEELTRHDPLTGALNRTGFHERVAPLLHQGQREGTPFSLLILDIDHFKAINDTWGHPAGDEVLRALTQRMRTRLRSSDVLARFGGEEFLVFLPGTGRSGALALAELLREDVGTLEVPWEEERVTFSLSVGVASSEAGQRRSFEELYRDADRALYAAKSSGRNREVHADTLPPSSLDGDLREPVAMGAHGPGAGSTSGTSQP